MVSKYFCIKCHSEIHLLISDMKYRKYAQICLKLIPKSHLPVTSEWRYEENKRCCINNHNIDIHFSNVDLFAFPFHLFYT